MVELHDRDLSTVACTAWRCVTGADPDRMTMQLLTRGFRLDTNRGQTLCVWSSSLFACVE
jgi:hypothetical protein